MEDVHLCSCACARRWISGVNVGTIVVSRHPFRLALLSCHCWASQPKRPTSPHPSLVVLGAERAQVVHILRLSAPREHVVMQYSPHKKTAMEPVALDETFKRVSPCRCGRSHKPTTNGCLICSRRICTVHNMQFSQNTVIP